MTRFNKKWYLQVIFVLLSFFATLPAQAGFLGQAVHADYLFPDTATTFTDLGNSVVGAGSEFSLTLASTLTVDFSDNNILITIFDANSSFTLSAFNGFHFFDVLNAIPSITNVAIAATNNFAFTPGGISFDADNIFLNFQGLSVLPDSALTLAVSFVPEPMSAALLGIGLFALARSRRKR